MRRSTCPRFEGDDRRLQLQGGHNAQQVAVQGGVVVKSYSIIYELLDDVRRSMEDCWSRSTGKAVGKAEGPPVRGVSKIGTIAGLSSVEGGHPRRSGPRHAASARWSCSPASCSSLKRFKDDVKSVAGDRVRHRDRGYNDVLSQDVLKSSN